MLLAIDCGNTNTVFSIWDGEKFLCTLRTSTHHARTADAYFTWFTTLVAHYGITPDIQHVIISSTVPRVVFNLRVFADRFFGCRPVVVGKPDCLLPVDVRVDVGTKSNLPGGCFTVIANNSSLGIGGDSAKSLRLQSLQKKLGGTIFMTTDFGILVQVAANLDQFATQFIDRPIEMLLPTCVHVRIPAINHPLRNATVGHRFTPSR